MVPVWNVCTQINNARPLCEIILSIVLVSSEAHQPLNLNTCMIFFYKSGLSEANTTVTEWRKYNWADEIVAIIFWIKLFGVALLLVQTN